MEIFTATAQVLIAIGLVNVWVFRSGRETAFRPDGANNLAEEFRRYGLPDWARTAVGSTKLTVAALMVVGLFYSPIAVPAAGVLALLMAGAIGAHLRVRDPLMKAIPAALMLLLSTAVIVGHSS